MGRISGARAGQRHDVLGADGAAVDKAKLALRHRERFSVRDEGDVVVREQLGDERARAGSKQLERDGLRRDERDLAPDAARPQLPGCEQCELVHRQRPGHRRADREHDPGPQSARGVIEEPPHGRRVGRAPERDGPR